MVFTVPTWDRHRYPTTQESHVCVLVCEMPVQCATNPSIMRDTVNKKNYINDEGLLGNSGEGDRR